MKTVSTESIILSGPTQIAVPGFESIGIDFRCDNAGNPADIVVVTRVEQRRFAQFLDRECPISNDKPPLVRLEYVVGSVEQSFLLLLGIFEIVFISPQTGNTCVTVKLYRNASEDRGFYRVQIFGFANSLLLRYESGALKLNHLGHVEWHTALKWDDSLLSADSEFLVFSNEHVSGGKPWKIRAADGLVA